MSAPTFTAAGVAHFPAGWLRDITLTAGDGTEVRVLLSWSSENGYELTDFDDETHPLAVRKWSEEELFDLDHATYESASLSCPLCGSRVRGDDSLLPGNWCVECRLDAEVAA
jgi:hypothetical protein